MAVCRNGGAGPPRTAEVPVRIALKVDVDTLRGTLEGVPNLLRLFDTYQVRATFLFSLGPDHTGRALRRVLRPGFLGRGPASSLMSPSMASRPCCTGPCYRGRTSVRHGRRGDALLSARPGMRSASTAMIGSSGEEFVAHQGRDWTRQELDKAALAYAEVFGDKPRVHGAAGWQINPHVLAWEGERGLTYASDTRGRSAFYPVLHGGAFRLPPDPHHPADPGRADRARWGHPGQCSRVPLCREPVCPAPGACL